MARVKNAKPRARRKIQKNASKRSGKKPVYLSKQELAAHFGVSVTAVSQWIPKGCPYERRASPGKPWEFDPVAVKKWRAELGKTTDDKKSGDGKYYEELARLNARKADLAELDLRKRRGELIEAEEAKLSWTKTIMAIRTNLLALPKKVAPRAYGCRTLAETVAVMEEEVNVVLRDLASPEFTSAALNGNADVGDGDVRATPKVKRKRVGGRKKNTQR